MTQDDRKTHGLVAVALPAGKVARPLMGRRGFIHGALIADWPAIAGPALAAHTLPTAIRFPKGERTGGVLEIKVASSAFAIEVQHLAPLVIERVNGYFGWKAVERLKLRHGPLPRLEAPRPKPPVVPASMVTDYTPPESVTDPDLRAALSRLAARLVRTPANS